MDEQRIRGSPAPLVLQLLAVGFFLWFLNLGLTAIQLLLQGQSPSTSEPEKISIIAIITFGIYVLNFSVFAIFFLKWLYHYYIITPTGFSKNYGVIVRDTETYDFKSIRSLEVHQGILGKIFGYGNIRLDSPLLKKSVHIEKISQPYKYAKLIEERRLKYLEGSDNVTPVYA